MQSNSPTLRLANLPSSGRWMLTLFLVLIGMGYLSALGNLYHQHQMADGKEGLTIDDLRVTFHGMELPADENAPSEPVAAESRMKEMIKPGGEMRKHLAKGGPEAIRALEQWLDRGAVEAEFTKAELVEPGDPSAESVIARHCLRCHNAEDGEKADTPYGPDLFDTDFAMVRVYAEPGTAKDVAAGDVDPGAPRRQGPHSVGHLFLVTHIHMLSIPVFTLIVSSLFLCTGFRPRLTAIVAPIPMLCLVADFLSWWLSLWAEGFIYVIATVGGVFGLSFGVQLLSVLAALWFGRAFGPDHPSHRANISTRE